MVPKQRSETQSQGAAPETTAAPPKSLSLLAQEEFGDAFHGEVVEQAPKPKPESDEPQSDQRPDIPEIPDEDLDEGGENRQVEGDEKSDEAKPATEDEAEPIASVRELIEHLEADPAWFDQLKVDVKVHDKASQVPLREIIDNYERDQAAGERLEQAKAKSAQAQQEAEQRLSAIDVEFHKAAKLVGMMEQQLQAEVAAINWDALKRDDPAMWSAERVRLSERQQQINQVKAQTAYEYQQVRANQETERNQRVAAMHQEQHQLMMQNMPKVSPDWGNPQKEPEVKARLSTYLIGQGFGHQEIAETLDHRAILIAEKARLWDESQAKVQLTKKRIQSVPRVIKPGARKEPSAINLEKVRAARQALKNTGDQEAAYALLKAERLRR